MQEEILEAASKRYSSKAREQRYAARSNSVQPSSPGPGILGTSPNSDKAAVKPKGDDKWAALRAARRAKGLCMKCGEPYSPQHRCPRHVPLHIMEEVLEIFQAEESTTAASDVDSHSSDEEILMLSACAAQGIQGKKTIRLQGLLQNHEVLILVYSGSSRTFISDQLVTKLNLTVTPQAVMQVTVADGGKLSSHSSVSKVQWYTQGHTFTSDARVLAIPYYDLILGMDWLEQYSPMWVDWKRKKLRFA